MVRDPELVYSSIDARGNAVNRAVMQAVVLGGGGAALLSFVTHAALVWSFVAVVVAITASRIRRAPDDVAVVLRVVEGRLDVVPRRAGAKRLSIPLDELLAVRLETKSVSSADRRGSSVELSRIVFALAGTATPFALNESPAPYGESAEWARQIRLFLRAHGWLPEDERAVDPPEPAPSSAR